MTPVAAMLMIKPIMLMIPANSFAGLLDSAAGIPINITHRNDVIALTRSIYPIALFCLKIGPGSFM